MMYWWINDLRWCDDDVYVYNDIYTDNDMSIFLNKWIDEAYDWIAWIDGDGNPIRPNACNARNLP